jgi:hypothetical protein
MYDSPRLRRVFFIVMAAMSDPRQSRGLTAFFIRPRRCRGHLPALLEKSVLAIFPRSDPT